jgi:Uma2 family endonuclease
MTTTTQVSLDEYLTTTYQPDVEYLDGELEERNVGEYDHNVVQRAITFWFHSRSRDWSIRSIQEQRTRLAPTLYRIPDVSIFRRDTPVEQIFTRPQLIAIEVLSPEDRHSRLQNKIKDYIQFQVPNIWIIDPKTREGWDCSTGNWVRKERFEVAGTLIYLSLDELFSDLDAEEA